MAANSLLLTALLQAGGVFHQMGPATGADPSPPIPITHCPLPTIITGPAKGQALW
jgi:hypothetical protein